MYTNKKQKHSQHSYQRFFWVTAACKQLSQNGQIYTGFISRKATPAFGFRFLKYIPSVCCKQGEDKRKYSSYDLDLQLCKCVLFQFTTDSLQRHVKKANGSYVCNSETFRITVTEWETFRDHLPLWLVLICIQNRDLHLDLTWDKICVPNANNWTFLNKLLLFFFFSYFSKWCIFIINVHISTSSSGNGTTTLFSQNLNSFTFCGLAPPFFFDQRLQSQPH